MKGYTSKIFTVYSIIVSIYFKAIAVENLILTYSLQIILSLKSCHMLQCLAEVRVWKL